MALNDRQGKDLKPHSLQHIANQSFDEDLQLNMVEAVGTDGQNIQRTNAGNLAYKMVIDGNTTYVARSAPGTQTTDPLWQVFKIDENSGLVITWADGDSQFDNTADDLASLNYL